MKSIRLITLVWLCISYSFVDYAEKLTEKLLPCREAQSIMRVGVYESATWNLDGEGLLLKNSDTIRLEYNLELCSNIHLRYRGAAIATDGCSGLSSPDLYVATTSASTIGYSTPDKYIARDTGSRQFLARMGLSALWVVTVVKGILRTAKCSNYVIPDDLEGTVVVRAHLLISGEVTF